MDDIVLVPGHSYVMAGDFFLDCLASAHCLFYNKQLCDDAYGAPEYLDNIVLEGGWTYEKMTQTLNENYVDLNGDGVRQEGDQFGIMSAPTVSQYAAIEAMRSGDRDIEAMRAEYDRRRRYLVHGLRQAGLECYEPKGAFYVFPDIRSTGLTSEDFCEKFLRAERVAVIPGSAFGPGGEGFVRMCYAASMEDLNEALVRLKRFLESLK